MTRRALRISLLSSLALCAAAGSAGIGAQSPEPAVDTSAPRNAPLRAPPTDTATTPPTSPAPPVAAGSTAANPAAAAPRRPANRVMDRVDLEASQITGNRELPRVLYIVPWRAPNPGDLEGRPVNSLLYELTKPVDRDVFRRENRYFDALSEAVVPVVPAGGPAAVAPPVAPDSAPGASPVRDTSQPRPTSGN